MHEFEKFPSDCLGLLVFVMVWKKRGILSLLLHNEDEGICILYTCLLFPQGTKFSETDWAGFHQFFTFPGRNLFVHSFYQKI
jgi:hypothetical protein